MVEEVEHLKKDVERAVGRVAAEYSYAKDLEEDLKKIESDTADDAIKDAKKGLKILRWIGRGERRAHRSEMKIIDELKALGNILPDKLKEQEEKLLQELVIADGKLVKAASMYTGDLRKELIDIQTDEQLLKRLEEKGDGEKVKQDLQRLFKDAERIVTDLIKWIRGTEVILKNIEGFERVLEKISA
jgi:hypothetical protein